MTERTNGQADAPSALTLRVLLLGALGGCALAAANVYLGLKTGWWDGGGVLAALGAYSLMGKARAGPSARAEVVLAQTAASAAAVMPTAMGVLGAIPALTLMGRAVPLWSLLPWGLVMGGLGLMLGRALRERMLVQERLPFPSAVAIAEVVSTLDRPSGRRDSGLALGALLGAALTWFREGRPAWLPGVAWLPVQWGGVPAQTWTLGVSVSPMLLGLGAIMGLRNALALGAGALCAWGALAPWLVASRHVASAGYDALVLWLVWPAAALMVASGFVTLAGEWRSAGRAVRDVLRASRSRKRLGDTLLAGALGGGAVWLGHAIFGLPWMASVGLLVLAVLLGAICIRVAGEASVAPIGQLAELTQAMVAAAVPSNSLANIGGGAVVSGTAVSAAQLGESYRVGQLLEVSPRAQLRASVWGVAVGTLVTVPLYSALTASRALGSPSLPAPGAVPWRAIAELSAQGAAAIPNGAALACALAAVAGVALELGRRTAKGAWLPSPLMVGLALVIPAHASFAIVLGAVVSALATWRGRSAKTVAAGAIAGESLAGIAAVVLVA